MQPKYFTPAEHAEIMAATIATFPATFGLRAFPGDTFRVSRDASYFATMASEVPTLYTERLQPDGTWLDFAKGTPSELRRNVVAVAVKLTAAEIEQMYHERMQERGGMD